MMMDPQTMSIGILDSLRLGVPEKRVGILGGTFNPIHNGHIEIGMRMRGEFGLNEVLYVVAGDPPHKDVHELAPARDRFEMTQLATMEYPGLWASDVEMHRPGRTYTVDTMRILQAKQPEAEFVFIAGEDTLYQFETWKDFGQLCKMTEFICVRRPGQKAAGAAAQCRLLAEKYDAVIHLSEYTGPDISSTQIRERIAEGKSIKGLVPPAVEEYIYAAGLYVRPNPSS